VPCDPNFGCPVGCDPNFGCDPGGCNPSDIECGPGGGCDPVWGYGPPSIPSGGDGGGTAGAPPATPDQRRRVGGNWPNNETLGLPAGMNLRPMSLAELLGLAPGTSCEFGSICVPIGNGLLGTGLPSGGSGSGFTIDVLVLAKFLPAIIAASSADPPCKVGNCTYTIYTKPRYPPGNACAGGHNEKGKPATFVSMWDCVGTVPVCKQNQSFYQDACFNAGNTPMLCTYECNLQAGACSYSCQCCNYR
jgi:hypothetical protein